MYTISKNILAIQSKALDLELIILEKQLTKEIIKNA